MIVFECICMYPAHWHAYTILKCKTKKIQHIASNAKTAGMFLDLQEDRGPTWRLREHLPRLPFATSETVPSRYVKCCHGPLCDLSLRPLLLRRHPLT